LRENGRLFVEVKGAGMTSKKWRSIGVALFSVLLFLSTAQADPLESQKRWYGGLGGGISRLEPETRGTSRVDDSNDLGLKFFGGFNFSERFALEGYYSDLGEAGMASPRGSIEYKTFGVSGLFYFLRENRSHEGWSLFGRLGVGRMRNSSDLNFTRDHDYHIMYGGGIEYGFKNGFALRTDVDLYDEDAGLLGIYLLKRFGGGGRKKSLDATPQKSSEAAPVPPPSDSDGDGVVDSADRCPNTPKGALVDRKGCELDSDDDGVIDSADLCPNTPKGAAVDENGCELDSDRDGMVDSADRCPNTPKGAVVDEKGCELVDSDGDGVVDSADRCPNTPKESLVDENGCELDSDGDGIVNGKDRCPETALGVKVDARGCQLKDVIVLEDVRFATDSAELIRHSEKALDEMVDTLKRHRDLRMEVAGHTDSRGPRPYNLSLSQRRAETVRNYLIAKGISADRLTAKGYGPDKPVGDNAIPRGQAANRRVELRILNK
jgi:OOP family OmpA-OmpF porin